MFVHRAVPAQRDGGGRSKPGATHNCVVRAQCAQHSPPASLRACKCLSDGKLPNVYPTRRGVASLPARTSSLESKCPPTVLEVSSAEDTHPPSVLRRGRQEVPRGSTSREAAHRPILAPPRRANLACRVAGNAPGAAQRASMGARPSPASAPRASGHAQGPPGGTRRAPGAADPAGSCAESPGIDAEGAPTGGAYHR